MKINKVAFAVNIVTPLLLISLLGSQIGCGGISTSSATKTVLKSSLSSFIQFLPPKVAPVVNKALPSGLQSTTTKIVAKVLSPLKNLTRVAALNSKMKVQNLKSRDQVHMTRAHAGPAHIKTQLAVGDTDLTAGVASAAATAAAADIKIMFTGYFYDINSGSTKWQGYLNNEVIQIDERLNGLVSTTSPPYCASITPHSFNLNLADNTNLGSIDPVLNFTLGQIQCYSASTSASGPTGSGMAFGQSAGCIAAQPSPNPNPSPSPVVVATGGCNYSLWLSMGQGTGSVSTTGGFLMAANINNAGSTTVSAPEQVDALIMQYGVPSGGNPGTVVLNRFKAVPTNNTFELYFAANNAGMADVNNPNTGNFALGYGLRMISDGVHIYADGVVATSAATPPNNGYPFNAFTPYHLCLNASDLSINTTSGSCTSLYSQFSITPASTTFNMCEITGLNSSSTPTAAACTASSSWTSASSANNGLLVSPPSVAQLNPVAASVGAAFAAVYPVTNASPVALPITAVSPTPSPSPSASPSP